MQYSSKLSSAFWSKYRRLNEREVKAAIAYWREQFHISQEVQTERISRFQVTGETGRPGCSLVGVVYDARSATIYHTRALTAEDIIHELLHVAHPEWSEQAVVHETDRLTRLMLEKARRSLSAAFVPA